MSLHVYDKLDQGSEAWHDVRRGMVTASQVGKLLTPTLKVADNDTSRALTATLVAERLTGFTEETGMTADMWRGVDSEPIARDIYSGAYQRAVEVGFLVLEESMPWDPNEVAYPVDEAGPVWQLGYSPDGLVGVDGLIEIKAPRAKGHLNTILRDEVPAYYMAQCQAGLLVSGRKWIDFVSYCGGMPLYVKRVYPDLEWQHAIKSACVAFEENAAAIVADYRHRVVDMPTTERIDHQTVELKLA